MKFNEYIKEEEKDNSELNIKLANYFKDNPYKSDDDFHKFAEENNIEPDDLEKMAYQIISTFMYGGMANKEGLKEEDVDQKELEMGTEVEYEHLDKKSPFATMMAKRISLDHLAELKDYYSRLKKMESEGGSE